MTRWLVVAAAGLITAASAQWLKYPSSNVPRTPDGKPNLPPPRREPPTASPIYRASGRGKTIALARPRDVPMRRSARSLSTSAGR